MKVNFIIIRYCVCLINIPQALVEKRLLFDREFSIFVVYVNNRNSKKNFKAKSHDIKEN